MTGQAVFNQITIIGLGLIGSSIARAARERHLAEFIAGCDINDTALTYARSHNYIDTAVRDTALAVNGSQMVILATPPFAFHAIARHIAPKLAPGTIVMDTASVKQSVMEILAPLLPIHADFVPAHPVAGSEQSGGSAGSDDLFQRRRIIVTPNEPLASHVLQAITSFWVGMGARIEAMPAPLHDVIYAYISHLPHLLAFAARGIVTASRGTSDNPVLTRFLRLSTSRAALWSEIFALNRGNMVTALDTYLVALRQIQRELTSAPAGHKESYDDAMARTVLFPRIAAACLINAVIEAEKQTGFSFARYAGRGFADFTSAAAAPPENDLEKISSHNQVVASVIKEYADLLQSWQTLLSTNRFSDLQQAISAVAA